MEELPLLQEMWSLRVFPNLCLKVFLIQAGFFKGYIFLNKNKVTLKV